MLVTDKQYYMENALVDKLELMIKRMHGKGTDDNVILIDGDEGSGKTNLEYAIAYYVAHQTGRELTLEKNLFFDLDSLITFAVNTKDQILLFDEGALGGLASEWWQKNQIKFIKLLMVCRKKRHFFIICIPKFFKLNEYLVVDRSISLIHVYAKQNLKKGYFFYFTKRKKEKLYYDWKKTHRRNYQGFKSIRGTFGITEDKLFDSIAYNLRKDQAIMGLDKKATMSKKDIKDNDTLVKIKHSFVKLIKDYGLNVTEVGRRYGLGPRTLYEWGRLIPGEPISLGKQGFEGFEAAVLSYNGGISQDSDIDALDQGPIPIERQAFSPETQALGPFPGVTEAKKPERVGV